jgi:hypothetical protein
VNDPQAMTWVKYGAAYSPSEMIKKIGAADYVTFETTPAREYLLRCKDRYD